MNIAKLSTLAFAITLNIGLQAESSVTEPQHPLTENTQPVVDLNPNPHTKTDNDHTTTVLGVWDNAQEIKVLADAIAGNTIPENNLQSKAHLDYNSFVDEKWERLEELSLIGAAQFEQDEVLTELDKNPNIKISQLFYPFGGPDIVYPLVLFPDIKSYVLVGLEPTGSISESKAPLNFVQLKEVMGNIFNSGFFVTHKMNANLKNFGTIPVLLGLLAKLEYIPTKVEEIITHNLKGVRIYFHNTMGDEKTVSYYSADLGKVDPNIFGESQVAMIKCCSYLMREQTFKLIKDYILNKVPFLLQDDTGIMYKDLSGRQNILYGEYTGPYGNDFPGALQSDLLAAYKQKENVRHLGFRIGYGFGRAPSNLEFSILHQQN